MSGTLDNSAKNVEALLKEARAVKRTTRAYNGLHRGGTASEPTEITAEAVSRQIVLTYLGGGR